MWLFTCVVFSWTLLGLVGCSSFSAHVIYQGCFSVLSLQRQKGHLIHPFIAEECLKLCSGNGHHHAGIDSINSICYCGNDIMSQISRAEDTLCRPCKDDTNLFCGGVLKLSLYEIVTDNLTNGIKEIESMFEEEPMILLAGHGGIYSYNTSTHDLRTVISVKYHVDAIDYQLRTKLGFAIWDDILYRFPLFEEGPLDEQRAKYIAHVNRCPTFAVDWVHDRIYWPDCYGHYITSIDFLSDHENAEILVGLHDEGAWAMDMAVDPYKGLLFWTSGATLWSCRLDGKGLRKVVPEFPVNRVSSLSLDLATERVYFSGLDKHDKNSSKLYYASYGGSLSHSLQFLEFEGGSHVLSFGIFNHHVYFIKSVENNFSVVMVSKLEYNHRPSIFLQEKGIQVNHLKLVHPQIQSPGKVDACTNQGCSHMCLVEASLPRCFCPRYYELELDNRTCIVNPGLAEEKSLLLKVVFGLMLVLMVLLGAGVLMCLCDKLWSQLHPTVVSLSVPGAAKWSFADRRRQDGENLI